CPPSVRRWWHRRVVFVLPSLPLLICNSSFSIPCSVRKNKVEIAVFLCYTVARNARKLHAGPLDARRNGGKRYDKQDTGPVAAGAAPDWPDDGLTGGLLEQPRPANR